MKHPKIIFFTRGIVPNKKEAEAIRSIPFPVSVRNAEHIGPKDACEPCAGVMGHIPDQYDDHPDGKQVVAAYVEMVAKRDAELKALDTPATQPPADTSKPPANGTGEQPPAQLAKPAGWVSGN
ncbi:hypothetical protein Axy20_046 [Achromobacter phage vB_AxyS_19-32_Axy20]|nr:hypothetical protein Axy19_045 [Achromobacter phage vB_AxyS_19-32_Axy19]QDH84516.1 hypothetical protein Axy20_046 [Achromobacter phage vB_AxyS_19-32_Axy20]